MIEEFLNPTYHEVWMRTAVLLVAVAFSIYIQHLLKREHETSVRARTAERFLNSVVDNIPNMVFIKDAGELRFVRINRAGEQLLGHTNEDLMGKNDYDVFPKPQAEFFTHKDRAVLESGVEVNIPEEQIDTVSQGKRWLHTRKVPIVGDNGQPIYLLGISEDITQDKQAALERKETELRFQTLFDSAADFIFVIDPEGQVLEVNRHACEQSGYKKVDIVGHSIKEFFTRESQETCDCNFPGLRERGYNRADIEFACSDGCILNMECMATAVPDENGHFTTFLIVQRDVTDKKRAEEAMLRQQRDMAHVMRLSTMGEMASGMAHELNQPLTALISYCGTASSLVNALPSSPPELGEVLARAEKQAHRASKIIWHLRDFIRKGDDQKESVDLDQVIMAMIEFITPELRNGEATIAYQPGAQGCKVMANKVHIEQVLINLVRNSLDALQESKTTTGHIVIQTRLLPENVIETTVTDNGPGIDADMVDKLFQPFQTSKSSGMGMGLSISRSIIEAHGGKLWIDHQYRDGALFGFTLPAGE